MGKVNAIARDNLAVVVVLGIAVAVRIAAAVAYRPALFFSDSWEYGDIARFHSYGRFFVPGFDAMRPSGYPLTLDLIAVIHRSAGLITGLQHLAGLVAGVIVYLLSRRLGASRLLAAAATALVVFDSYAIALEQHVLSETFYGFTLLLSLFVLSNREGGWTSTALSGVLLALAITMRTVGLFAVPVWVAYLLITRRGRRPAIGAALAALTLSLLLYAGAHAAAGRGFALTESDGWFLYGRVGELVDCSRFTPSREERPLCETPPERLRYPLYYIWSLKSPAGRLFGDAANLTPAEARHSNAVLKGFAVKTIKSRPGAYGQLVASDFLRYFVPGRMSPYGPDDDTPIIFPARPRSRTFDARHAGPYFAIGQPPGVHPPAGAVRGYQKWVHAPRWLLGLLAFASVAALLAGLSRRAGLATVRRPEVFLLSGTALLLMLGSVATADFAVRFMEPVIPLLVVGGLAAMLDLYALARGDTVQPGETGERVAIARS